jgi:hypothetical protein
LILNLLIIDIVFTVLFFKKEISFYFSKLYIIDCKNRCTLIRGMLVKK